MIVDMIAKVKTWLNHKLYKWLRTKSIEVITHYDKEFYPKNEKEPVPV